MHLVRRHITLSQAHPRYCRDEKSSTISASSQWFVLITTEELLIQSTLSVHIAETEIKGSKSIYPGDNLGHYL